MSGHSIFTSAVFTSEAVSAGHPDKVADQISGATPDLLLEQDPEAQSTATKNTDAGIL